jgi:hypothetical protein
MKLALSLLFGIRPPRAAFEGSAGERRVYESACSRWRAAGYYIRNERFLDRTLGAKVSRRTV